MFIYIQCSIYFTKNGNGNRDKKNCFGWYIQLFSHTISNKIMSENLPENICVGEDVLKTP